MRLLEGAAPARKTYVVAAAIGLATYLIVFGLGHLFGTNAYWAMPLSDERMALIGYRYFLHEPWHWPIFVSHTINVPYHTSVAFFDCIPLWAVVNKAAATVVPPWRTFSVQAYLGLWHGVTYVLQPCLCVACLRALGHRSWRAGLVTAVFFVAVPAWIFRYSHSALSAHWIELWALLLYLRTPPGEPGRRRLGLAKLAQLAVASLVAPYHTVMSFGMFAASLGRTRHARTILTWLPLGALSAVGALWLCGYFTHEIATSQWGFDQESANVLSWLVPLRSGLVGDARSIVNVSATPWQYEGYAYLGAGFLALLIAYVPSARRLPDLVRRHRWLFLVALGFGLFALSNHIYLGSHELASFAIPRHLRWLPKQFRSPGRFVWVPMYVLMVFVLHRGLTRFSTSRGFLVLVVLAALQVVDASGDWALVRGQTAGPHWPVLARDAWRPLIQTHDAVFVFPTFSCVSDTAYDSVPHLLSTEIAMLASERGIPINGSYNTRPTRNCADEARAWPTVVLQPRTLYVLLPEAAQVAERFQAAGAFCAGFDHGRVCSTNEAAITAAIRAGILH